MGGDYAQGKVVSYLFLNIVLRLWGVGVGVRVGMGKGLASLVRGRRCCILPAELSLVMADRVLSAPIMLPRDSCGLAIIVASLQVICRSPCFRAVLLAVVLHLDASRRLC